MQLCEVVKLGAMSLGSGSPEPQVLVLHAARDVAAALRDLAAATTAASGKPGLGADMQRLKHAAKVTSARTAILPPGVFEGSLPARTKGGLLTLRPGVSAWLDVALELGPRIVQGGTADTSAWCLRGLDTTLELGPRADQGDH